MVKRILLQCGRLGFNPRMRKIPWRREWQSTPVFLPAESHGQSNQEGYNCKESDTTEQLTHTHTHTHTHTEFCCSGRLWERSLVFSSLLASNKSYLLLFRFVVSFGFTPTKRQSQFWGDSSCRGPKGWSMCLCLVFIQPAQPQSGLLGVLLI